MAKYRQRHGATGLAWGLLLLGLGVALLLAATAHAVLWPQSGGWAPLFLVSGIVGSAAGSGLVGLSVYELLAREAD